MNNKIIALFFSATDTTAKYVNTVVSAFKNQVDCCINLADDLNMPLPEISADDIVIFAAPVYGGRLPEMVAKRFVTLKGNGANAIAMVVYGNRDYDDALLELTDIVSANGFSVVGAGAFIGQHSIFPCVAKNRPDESDLKIAIDFATKCKEAIADSKHGNLTIKGNHPYKKIMNVGLTPKVNIGLCYRCGLCATNCPANAISKDDPTITSADKCISCGRCIVHCPNRARSYTGKLIGAIFTKAFSKRKEPEVYVV
ncbi:MAG: 4Fe-4S binding protein [Muribaculaceae bacterium]|nr:4Fe-4S binding protein [Muribaculaceae bacterium]